METITIETLLRLMRLLVFWLEFWIENGLPESGTNNLIVGEEQDSRIAYLTKQKQKATDALKAAKAVLSRKKELERNNRKRK